MTNIDDLIIWHTLEPICYESVILFYLFGHLVQISDNWRYWLHIQKVYIHSYFTLIDCGALRKHIVTNIGDFVILTPPGANFLEIWDIFTPIWPLVTNLGQFVIWIGNENALYPFILHFDWFWGIEEAYFDKYWRFNNFYTPWSQFFMNLWYFFTYFANGYKLLAIGDLGCISKMFISIHTSLWWILWHCP